MIVFFQFNFLGDSDTGQSYPCPKDAHKDLPLGIPRENPRGWGLTPHIGRVGVDEGLSAKAPVITPKPF